jgi:hypothetical protein
MARDAEFLSGRVMEFAKEDGKQHHPCHPAKEIGAPFETFFIG